MATSRPNQQRGAAVVRSAVSQSDKKPKKINRLRNYAVAALVLFALGVFTAVEVVKPIIGGITFGTLAVIALFAVFTYLTVKRIKGARSSTSEESEGHTADVSADIELDPMPASPEQQFEALEKSLAAQRIQSAYRTHKNRKEQAAQEDHRANEKMAREIVSKLGGNPFETDEVKQLSLEVEAGQTLFELAKSGESIGDISKYAPGIGAAFERFSRLEYVGKNNKQPALGENLFADMMDDDESSEKSKRGSDGRLTPTSTKI